MREQRGYDTTRRGDETRLFARDTRARVTLCKHSSPRRRHHHGFHCQRSRNRRQNHRANRLINNEHDPGTLEGATTVFVYVLKGVSNKDPLVTCSFKSLSTQYYARYISMGFAVSDEVSSTFQGPPGLDGMKVSDPRDDPVFTIHYFYLLICGRAIFPLVLSASRAFVRRDTKVNGRLDREYREQKRKDKRARERFSAVYDDVCQATRADVRQVSSYFQGAQGEPGTKGERGDPGLPVSPSRYIKCLRRAASLTVAIPSAPFSCLSARTRGYLEFYRYCPEANPACARARSLALSIGLGLGK